MTVPLGMTQRATPLEAATAKPVPPPATVSALAPMFWISMNSSLAPLGPRTRNSEMTSVEDAALADGVSTALVSTTPDARRRAATRARMRRWWW